MLIFFLLCMGMRSQFASPEAIRLTYLHMPARPREHRQSYRVIRAPISPANLSILHERPLRVLHPLHYHALSAKLVFIHELSIGHIS